MRSPWTGSDWFYDPIEIEYALQNADEIVAELAEELRHPEAYAPRTAFAYFSPKNELCDRRMVYVPIKDLIVRYALAILFADEIEIEIHPQCFANRRATGAEAKERFTRDFAKHGWASFCAWQRRESESNTVLLRTDISAFYDSVSHEYLVDAACRHLDLPSDCTLVSLFRRLLRIQVIYYSPSNNHVEGPAEMCQGLPIGDGVEGFLANILLKDVDDAMAAADATYGRYVDDIRLFGRNRQEVMQRLRILQEQLLRKHLNLNSAKTIIAEDRKQLGDVISHNYSLTEYGEEEPIRAGLEVLGHIDLPFEAFCKTFSEDKPLANGNDAKDFCKFLSANSTNGKPVIPIANRRTWHLDRLREVVTRWRGPSRHASWLLVQTATYRGVPGSVQSYALEAVLELLESEDHTAYARYRIMHHLLKRRRTHNGKAFRFLDNLKDDAGSRIMALVPSLLGAPAFELNLIGLHLASVSGRSPSELRKLVSRHTTRGCQPVRNALTLLGDGLPESILPGVIEHEHEPDEVPIPY